jgi:hypothetical protein
MAVEIPHFLVWIEANSPTALQRQWKWGNAQIKKFNLIA